LLSGFPTIDYNNAGMVLSGANSNTGGTMVLGGSLIMAVDGAIPDGTSLTVGAGGTFIFDPSFSVASSDTSATTAVSTPTNMASSCPLLLMPTEANVSTSGSVAVPSSVFVPGLAGDWPVQSSAPLATLPVGLLLPASSSAPQRNGGAKSVPFGLGRTPAFNKFVASSVAKRIVGDLAWLGQTANNSDNSDQRHKKDSTILALEAAFAQYGQ
jgi:hypothetical protein